MEIKQMQQLKEKLETELATMADDALQRFIRETGVTIESIHIDLIDVTHLGSVCKEKRVAGVTIDVRL